MNSEEDDVTDLLALMEDDEENGKENEEDNETSGLEEEYLELERKMKAVQEKMNKKKANSPNEDSKPDSKKNGMSPKLQNCTQSAPTESPGVSMGSPKNKSSFLTALSSAPYASPRNSCQSLDKSQQPTNSKRLAGQSALDNGLPLQKKRRIANISPAGSCSTSNAAPQARAKQDCNASSHQARRHGQSETVVVESEYFSRIRMKKCFVPSIEMKQRMQAKRFLKLGLIRSTMQISEDTDWVTIGVVSKEFERQAAKSGKPFSIWHLTDLEDCTKTVTFFLFGTVQEKLTKQIAVGSVIGVLNPSIMPPKNDETQKSYDNSSPALTVDVAERVMHIGLAADLGWCTATKWRNKQPAGKCLAVVNKQISDVCVYHMKSKYNKTSAKRSELQGSAAAPVAKKYKNTLWNNVKNDQFFYGGKVYSANPSGMAGNLHKPTDVKVKLTKFLQNHSDLAAEGKKELMHKSKVMNALGGIEGNYSMSGCSQTFADMLTSGDNVAGSRQFLNHLNNTKRKEEELKKTQSRPQTAAEVLKERASITKTKKDGNLVQKENKTPSKPTLLSTQLKMNGSKMTTTTSFVSSNDIRKMTADIVKKKKLELSKTVAPKLSPVVSKLGRGSSSDEIELFGDDWAIPKTAKSQRKNAELAKKKAIAKLRSESGVVTITRKDPNKGVLQQLENVRQDDSVKLKILEKVNRNREVLKETTDSKVESSLPLKNSKFGNMSEQEFEKILNSKSSFSREIESSEIEEQEKYFNPLIRKEMMETKMLETFEISCKVVTCVECKYTFWASHDRCKELQHHLNWRNAKKKFFQCSNCKHRTTTWEPYPLKPCYDCGSERNWHRTSMMKEKDVKVLDAETLLIRGLEHGKFISSLK